VFINDIIFLRFFYFFLLLLIDWKIQETNPLEKTFSNYQSDLSRCWLCSNNC